MFYPIGDENVQGGSFPLISYSFIGLNIIVFLIEASLDQTALENFIFTFGAIPNEITRFQDIFTLFTSMFLHGGWMHLIGNMLFLWIFADNIEATVGSFKFTVFYILGGLAAALSHIVLNVDSTVPMVGASGAISAVLGAYIVMYPTSRIKVIFLMFFFAPFYLPAFAFLGIWIVEQMVSGMGSLAVQTADTAGVAWWAHIGGFVFGVIAGFFFRQTHNTKYALG